LQPLGQLSAQKRQLLMVLTIEQGQRRSGSSSRTMLVAAAMEYRFESLLHAEQCLKCEQIVSVSDSVRLLEVALAMAPCVLQVTGGRCSFRNVCTAVTCT